MTVHKHIDERVRDLWSHNLGDSVVLQCASGVKEEKEENRKLKK